MKGHDHILTLRKGGKAPPVVFVDTEADDRLGLSKCWPSHGMHAQVWIEPADAISRLDLRWCIGLRVLLDGSNPERVKEADEALQKAGAARVIAHTYRVTRPGEEPRLETVSITDTAGAADGTRNP